MSDLYPEVIPEGIGKIPLNLVDNHVAEDVRLRREAIETRIRRISDKCSVTIQGQTVPLLDNIVGLRISKPDLKLLATGLDRIADLVEDLDKLKAQEKVIELAGADPQFFAWAFGLSDTNFVDRGVSDIELYLKNETNTSED